MADSDFISFSEFKSAFTKKLLSLLPHQDFQEQKENGTQDINLHSIHTFLNIDNLKIKYNKYKDDNLFDDNIYISLIDIIFNYVHKIMNYHSKNVDHMVLTEITFYTPINCSVLFTFPLWTNIIRGTCSYNNDEIYGDWCSEENYPESSGAKIKYLKVNSLELTKKLFQARTRNN